jgi:hypothetical protein
MTRLVTPNPLPVSTIVVPSCTAASAIAGFPITIVSAARESLTILAWFMVTSIPSPACETSVEAASSSAAAPAMRKEVLDAAIAILQAEDVFNER